MTEIVTAQFSLTINEIIAADKIYKRIDSRKDFRNTIFMALLVVFGFISLLTFIWIVMPSERRGMISYLISLRLFFLVPIIVIVGLDYILLPLLRRFVVWRSYRATKNLHDREIHFTDQGIDLVRSNANSHFDWSYFQSVMDHKDYLLIVYGKGLYFIIPKRVISENQKPIVSDILKSHIGKYEIKD